ncbi:hypothetical protein ACJX0J_014274 [Zea mays]
MRTRLARRIWFRKLSQLNDLGDEEWNGYMILLTTNLNLHINYYLLGETLYINYSFSESLGFLCFRIIGFMAWLNVAFLMKDVGVVHNTYRVPINLATLAHTLIVIDILLKQVIHFYSSFVNFWFDNVTPHINFINLLYDYMYIFHIFLISKNQICFKIWFWCNFRTTNNLETYGTFPDIQPC